MRKQKLIFILLLLSTFVFTGCDSIFFGSSGKGELYDKRTHADNDIAGDEDNLTGDEVGDAGTDGEITDDDLLNEDIAAEEDVLTDEDILSDNPVDEDIADDQAIDSDVTAIIPETSITAQPDSRTKSTMAVFKFSSTDAASTFKCGIDTAGWEDCTTPKTYTGLSEGMHNFSVRAISSTGHEDPTPASYTWEIDLTAPEVQIISKPASVTNSQSVEFTFETEADAIAETKLDSFPWEVSVSPKDYAGLLEGSHSFNLRATDDVGNTTASPEIYSWVVDITPPVTELTNKPSAISGFANADFAFKCSELFCAFMCSLDSATPASCSSPLSYSGLADGVHSFTVAAADQAGNAEVNPLVYNWQISTTDPDTTLTKVPPYYSNQTFAIFEFTSNIAGSTFACKVDSGSWAGCSSPFIVNSLQGGIPHTFSVRCVTPTGIVDSTPATYIWNVDSGEPQTSITNQPDSITASRNALFEFTSNYTNSTFECRLDNNSWQSCVTPKVYSMIDYGTHSFYVKATNQFGNTDSTPAQYSWKITGGEIDDSDTMTDSDTTGDDDIIPSDSDETPDADGPKKCYNSNECNDNVSCTIDICDNGFCRNIQDHSVCTGGKICYPDAGCMPAKDRLCKTCTASSECAVDGDICSDIGPDSMCLIHCDHNGLCPSGFSCNDILDDTGFAIGKACYPDNGVCCLDIDKDNAGIGYQCTAFDCDETNASIYQGAVELCDNIDNNCDNKIDELWPSKDTNCYAGIGQCMSSGKWICDAANPSGALVCTAKAGDPQPEVCDEVDNNCDNLVDNSDIGMWDDKYEMCEVGIGECYKRGLKVCNPANPAGPTICSVVPGNSKPEECDGKDNNCDDKIDNDLPKTLCPLQLGVCANAEKVCMAELGWSVCGVNEYGALYEKTESSCDGYDNDCDGSIDNVDPAYAELCPLQKGVCKNSTKKCQGGIWMSCIADDYGPNYEDGKETLCDGLDNDCNGVVDDLAPDALLLCLNQKGVCTGAKTVCEDGSLKSCGYSEFFNNNSEYQTIETKCDNLDNDCDGTTDNVDRASREKCENQSGVCLNAVKVCQAGVWQACGDSEYADNSVLYEAGIETKCDGLDNNCDGNTDNIPDAFKQFCGKQDGVCLGSKMTCSGGSWQACVDGDYINWSASYEAGEETQCDNLDNNCDGSTDNLAWAVRPLCGNQNGVCAGAKKRCVAGAWQADCTIAEYKENNSKYEEGDELSCDALDNNCDGIADNIPEVKRQPCEKQQGVCSGAAKTCSAGIWQACDDNVYLTHNPAYETGQYEVKCDNLDNNCDGQTDNLDSSLRMQCENQNGVCKGALRKCAAGQWQTSCTAAEYLENNANYEEGSETKCDGLDNNCDTLADNIADSSRQLCDKQQGVCSGSKKTCSAGAWKVCTDSDYLNFNASFEPGAEEQKCDNIDNNCDGTVDNLGVSYRLPCENQNGVCSGTKRKCAAGQWQSCTAADYLEQNADFEQGSETKCDGKDNNCDSNVDNIALANREPCAKQGGICAGSKKLCLDGQWLACTDSDYLNYNASYEAGTQEQKCDNIDNNCDSIVDNVADSHRLPCSNQTGVCLGALKRCSAGVWSDCNSNDYLARDASYQSGDENICDNKDNNCDGFIDNIPASDRQLCDKQAGICAGSKKICQSGAWLACTKSDYMNYNPAYDEGDEVKCDLLDNNCDGTVDNVADAFRVPCANQSGVCSGSLRKCTGGQWKSCSNSDYTEHDATYETGPETICDNKDNNCDGLSDNIAKADRLPCTNQKGVCSGAKQTCSGGSWHVCSDVEYANNSNYYESGNETLCDSLDNNCDGTADNILKADSRPCPNQNGVCSGSVRRCLTGVWQTCDASDYLANSPLYESGNETKCDSLDNNCDNLADNIAESDREPCPKQDGVCSGSRKTCSGGTYQSCTDATYLAHNQYYQSGAETLCDTYDNNCNGSIDESLKDTDINNCGACGNICQFRAHLLPKCASGVCMPDRCEDSWADKNHDVDFTKPLAMQAPGNNGCEYACEISNGGVEMCDGLDNDCNGQIDDNLTAPNCANQNGVCSGSKKVCGGVSGWLACGASEYLANNSAYQQGTETLCDGFDNNCNGSVDETLEAYAPVCGEQRGACQGSKKICSGGSWQNCGVPQYTANNSKYQAVETLCDGVDNNCDGSIDNGLTAPGCDNQKGVCSGANKVCGGANGWLACGASEYLANSSSYQQGTETVCDGKDNNCDGNVDEGVNVYAPLCDEQRGACQGAKKVCGSGTWQACGAVEYTSNDTDYQAAETLCDGIDNNCDGQVDEPFSAQLYQVCFAGSGLCQASGINVCNATHDGVTCNAVPGAAPENPELTCDGLDNNCNGQIDEPYSRSGGVCSNTVGCNAGDPNCCKNDVCYEGVGVCSSAGIYTCSGAGVACNAAPGLPTEPGTEDSCDNIDNNCDGTVDEPWTRSGGVCSNANGCETGDPNCCKNDVCYKGVGICRKAGFYECGVAGSVACNAVAGAPGVETCNNLDDNCDGEIDETWKTGGKYAADNHCGNCDTDCTAIYSKPNAYGKCDATGTPVCAMHCNSGYFDMNLVPGDGCEFHLDSLAIYVSQSDTGATDSITCGLGPIGTGVSNFPCKTISHAMTRAVMDGRIKIIVADGLYEETVTISDGISIYGGYRSDTWERHMSSTMTILRGTAAGLHKNTIIANGITTLPTYIQGFVIYGQNNTAAGGNSYAIYASGSNENLQILNNTIYSGYGGPGANGTSGSKGTDGIDGTGRPSNGAGYDAFDGNNRPCTDTSRSYTNGGALTCGAQNVNGGNGGGTRCAPSGGNEYSGIDGSAGQGTSAGTGGDAGDDGSINSSGLCTLPGNPMAGADGTNGTSGTNGTAGTGCSSVSGNVSGGHWSGSQAVSGGAGTNGSGGGGGGAGGGGDSNVGGTNDRIGGVGGGGGSGSCGGTAGTGGFAGGGSFAIFIVGGTAPVIQNNSILLGLGGDGGNGGNGGAGGVGGRGGGGGLCSGSCWCYSKAGKGGEGGNGGHAGGGGGGCGGPAFGVYTSSTGGSPNYCTGNGNSFSGGAGGTGGAGGNSYGSSGTAGTAGTTANCSNN